MIPVNSYFSDTEAVEACICRLIVMMMMKMILLGSAKMGHAKPFQYVGRRCDGEIPYSRSTHAIAATACYNSFSSRTST